MTDPISVVFDALEQVLSSTDSTWKGRVYFGRATHDKVRPYVVIGIVSGIDREEVVEEDPQIVAQVKCVAVRRDDALFGKREIVGLLDDQGEDDQGKTVFGDDTWAINTISKNQDIYEPEYLGSAGSVYHAGNQYEIVLGLR